MINKQNKLNKDQEINDVFKNKKKCYNRYVGVLIKENSIGFQRFVIIISRKTLKGAVVRNKIRRQVKDIITKHQKDFKFYADMVLIIKSEIEVADYVQIEEDILFCLRKLKIIK